MTDRLDTVRRVFDERAATYDESQMHRRLAEAVTRFADLSDVDSVLDVATGTGLVLRAIDASAPGTSLTGLDVSPGMLAVARAQLPSATFIEADAAMLPHAAASVDLITCVTGLHAIPDAVGAIAEWRRVLRAKGRVISATFLASDRRAPLGAGHSYPADHRPFDTLERLTATAKDHGFTVVRWTNWPHEEDELLIAEWAPSEDWSSRALRRGGD